MAAYCAGQATLLKSVLKPGFNFDQLLVLGTFKKPKSLCGIACPDLLWIAEYLLIVEYLKSCLTSHLYPKS